MPETADQLAAYDLVGLGIFTSRDDFAASELTRVIVAKLKNAKK